MNFFVDKIPAFRSAPGAASSHKHLRPMRAFLLALLAFASACAHPAVETMQPTGTGIRGVAYVHAVELSLSNVAKAAAGASDEKLKPGREGYAGMKFAPMLVQAVKDAAAARGLRQGRALTIEIELDQLNVPDLGGAFLGGRDRLAGQVKVVDARTGEALGSFYVDVDQRSPGLIGVAVRGGGVREKLASAFARHVADQLAPPPRVKR